MAMLLTPRNQSIAIEVTIQPDGWKNEAFEQLKADSQGIESELGTQLDWRQMPEKGSSKVILESKIDPKVETNRKRVCDWFAMWTPKMFVAFRDRVKKLAAPEGE